jgi:hypothetical protein
MSFGIKVIESLAIADAWFGKPSPHDVQATFDVDRVAVDQARRVGRRPLSGAAFAQTRNRRPSLRWAAVKPVSGLMALYVASPSGPSEVCQSAANSS